jgi:beta-barrel assembly-enhancing protease
MKRLAILVAILAITGVSIYFAQYRKRHDQVSANAVVDVAADWQRDLSRAPMQMTRISDAEESRIGDELAQRYEPAPDSLSAENKSMEKYVGQVGERVSAHARRRLSYRFHLIPDRDLINAFALPGGQVFIGQGLLDQMTSEDELAFVLGHEIEHIDHYHAVERVQVEAQLHQFNLDVVAAVAQIPMGLWQMGYTKDQEFEADREGLRIAAAAGYSPQGAVNMMARLAKLDREYVIRAETPTGELSQLAVQGLAGYFRSHPEPSERMAQVQEVIVQDRLPMKQPLTPFHVEYEVTGR